MQNEDGKSIRVEQDWSEEAESRRKGGVRRERKEIGLSKVEQLYVHAGVGQIRQGTARIEVKQAWEGKGKAGWEDRQTSTN